MNRLPLFVTGLGLAAASLTACGGDSGSDEDFAKKSGSDIADAANDAMDGLTSVHFGGTISSQGEEVELDLQASSGGDCTGSIRIGDGSVELLGVDGTTWMRPDETAWRTLAGDSADDLISLVGDKWVVIPEDEESFNEFCDLDDLIEQMLEDDDDDATYTTKGTDEVDGQDVVAVESKSDEGVSTGYVSLEDPHYLVQVEKTEGDSTGTMTFSDFDADVDVEAPADDDVIDLNNTSS